MRLLSILGLTMVSLCLTVVPAYTQDGKAKAQGKADTKEQKADAAEQTVYKVTIKAPVGTNF